MDAGSLRIKAQQALDQAWFWFKQQIGDQPLLAVAVVVIIILVWMFLQPQLRQK